MTPTWRLASVGVCLGTPAATKFMPSGTCPKVGAPRLAIGGGRLGRLSWRIADDRSLGACCIVVRSRIGGEPNFDLAPYLYGLVRNCRRHDRPAYHWRCGRLRNSWHR